MNGSSQALLKVRHLLSLSRTTTTTTTTQFDSLLHHYATVKSLTGTKQLHAHIIISGILSSYSSTDLCSSLISSYAICGHLSYARQVFDESPHPSLWAYNNIIKKYTQSGLLYNAVQLFVEMLGLGDPKPDRYTYLYVIKACGELSLIEFGVSLHSLTVTTGFVLNVFVANSLLAMYMNCGHKEGARRVFETMLVRTAVSWNTMISGYSRNGSPNEALIVFREMRDVGCKVDSSTVVSVLPVCGSLQNLEVGREVNALVEENDLANNLSVRNALVDMYAKCHRMDEARVIFDKTAERDVVTWTTMIHGYILNGDGRKALGLCPLMQSEGVKPNVLTLACLLSACVKMDYFKNGKCLHGWAIRKNLESDVNVETALIDMYAKCNSIALSFRVFSKIPKKRTVPWNAILSGCIHNGLAREAVILFKQMMLESVCPNGATLKSLLPAYSTLADLQQATNLHSYLIKSRFISKTEVATGLVDIYSKCGNLEYAHSVFDTIPSKDKDIILWSVIIAGYGMHGHGSTAVALFNEMVRTGVEPNEVTFTSVLHACSHAGLVDEGTRLFKSMLTKSQHFNPHVEHYTCIVDLLGRAGRLDEAYELIKIMPFPATHSVWGALLGSCVIHENVDLGEVAAKRLFELEPNNTGNYVLLGKIYAAVGRWKDAENLRLVMNEIGLVKEPACSSVEVRNM